MNDSTTTQKHVIDLAGDPMPAMWKKKGFEDVEIEKHTGEGLIEIDPSQLRLYLSVGQMGLTIRDAPTGSAARYETVGKTMRGRDLLKELEESKIPVLNACVLNYLLLHPEMIPEDWKVERKNIVFWGTIFRAPSGMYGEIRQYVLHMTYLNGRWHTFESSPNGNFGAGRPAAILAPLQPIL